MLSPLSYRAAYRPRAAVPGAYLVGVLVIAVAPRLDPLELSDRGRVMSIWLAELFLALLFLHLQLNVPDLIRFGRGLTAFVRKTAMDNSINRERCLRLVEPSRFRLFFALGDARPESSFEISCSDEICRYHFEVPKPTCY
jgi:hypothetical protein